MSHWQKTKLKHKEGLKKKQIEERFGIKTKSTKEITKNVNFDRSDSTTIEFTVNKQNTKKSKKKSK